MASADGRPSYQRPPDGLDWIDDATEMVSAAGCCSITPQGDSPTSRLPDHLAVLVHGTRAPPDAELTPTIDVGMSLGIQSYPSTRAIQGSRPVPSCWVSDGKESGNFPSDPVVIRQRWVAPAQLSSFRVGLPFPLGSGGSLPCLRCVYCHNGASGSHSGDRRCRPPPAGRAHFPLLDLRC